MLVGWVDEHVQDQSLVADRQVTLGPEMRLPPTSLIRAVWLSMIGACGCGMRPANIWPRVRTASLMIARCRADPGAGSDYARSAKAGTRAAAGTRARRRAGCRGSCSALVAGRACEGAHGGLRGQGTRWRWADRSHRLIRLSDS